LTTDPEPHDDGAPPPAGRSSTVRTTTVPGEQAMVGVLGTRDQLLKVVEDAFDVDILVRGNAITVTGQDPQPDQVVRVFDELAALVGGGQELDAGTVSSTIQMVTGGDHPSPSAVLSDEALTHRGRSIRPKTFGQKQYLDAIRTNTVTFGIGPAGTGKTYLAMAMAVLALKRREVSRIILTRPAVEAGERLGFLPGTLFEKIDPYLRPLFDALHDMMDAANLSTLMERGVIEVAPLAYMRGRSLNDAFIVLDEAQNTTPEQMKMFLTRIGFGSKAVVTGDITQVDLPGQHRSGLRVVREILRDIEGIGFAELSARDVVRHPIVQQIVTAYERWTDEQAADDQRASDPSGPS
jgi:phosphate starvation-inducible protein PhoH and related proteins